MSTVLCVINAVLHLLGKKVTLHSQAHASFFQNLPPSHTHELSQWLESCLSFNEVFLSKQGGHCCE